MTIISRMSSIQIIMRQEHRELFTLELGKITEFDLVYTLASTNINQSVPYLVRMSLIMDVIRPELSKLFALDLENFPYLTLFTL